MMGKNLERLLDFVVDTRIEAQAAKLQDHIRMCFLDLAMAMVCGAHNPSSKLGARYAALQYPGADATVMSTGTRAGLLGATLANAVAANALDIDDGFSLTKGHPGAGVISGILAMAEHMDSTFGDVLSALLVGYEVAIRQGLALQDYYGFYHSTGSYAGVGTAAAAGKLRRLDREQLANAIGIADYYGPLTPCMRTVRVPSLNKDGIYLGSRLGMEAVLLAEAGFDGKAQILQDAEYDDLVDSLGRKFYSFDLYFKFFSCCRWAHGALTALKKLRAEREIDPKAIEAITVYSYGASGELYSGMPVNETEAQYNLRYPIAVYLCHGDFGPMESSVNLDRSETVEGLMKKIRFVNDPAYEKQFPARRYTRVEVRLGDVTLDSGAVEPIGEPNSGVTVGDIVEKGLRINGCYHTDGEIDGVIQSILSASWEDRFMPILKGMIQLASV